MAEQSLKDKTVKGAAWSTIDNVAQFGVTFVVSIVLARLLTPDDYGLIGIVSIFTAICQTLINGGFTTALIRKNNVSEADYNTVFIVNLGMSCFLYCVVFLFSPLIAFFFCRDELIALTRVASLSMIVGALAMVQQTRLTKRIDFKSQTKITIVASVVSGVLGIVSALAGLGVWAIVIQQLSSQIIRTLLLWIVNKWLPRLTFSRVSFRELFGFGWKMMISALLETIWKELYQVVVGKYYNPATLGQYTRSSQFASLFSNNLTNVVERVSYPVLSSIQEQKERMVSAYKRIIKVTMFVAAISMFFIGSIADPLLYCLIGPQWKEAASYLPLICVSGAIYPLHAINLNMLKVQGRSDLYLGIEIIKKIVALVPIIIGALVGIMPMLFANLAATIIAFFLNSYFSGRYLGYSSWMQIKDISQSFVIAIIIALSVYFLKYLPISFWVILPLQLITGAGIFFLICRLFKVEEYKELKVLFSHYIINK